MIKSLSLIATVLLLITLTACTSTGTGSVDTPAAVTTDTSTPTNTPLPTSTPEPTLPPTAPLPPSPTPGPTAAEVAPENTFTHVGNVAHLSGIHGVAGKAIVAGLQTLIIQGFYYDGKGGRLDIRLVKGEDWENPVAILTELEERIYEKEMLYMIIPSSAGPGTVDHIVVYAPDTNEVYALAKFQ
jgi:hypothetical protein